ncbi:hypothetical protein B0H11DRAFT_2045209 [Mycena galericulata]|nr:hypothetical protein B0H11DRAFT_2045209 [Mycena galericulata]
MSSKEHISAWYWAHIIRHRAVITRWTAHYQAFWRLQQVQSALTAVIEQEMGLPPNEHSFVRGHGVETSRGMTLDEEMDLYELLDFDAEGEAEEGTVDVDDITESILIE